MGWWSKNKEEIDEITKVEEEGICRTCVAVIPLDTEECLECEEELEPPEEDEGFVKEEDESLEGDKRCPDCGTENPDNSNYCQSCGEQLDKGTIEWWDRNILLSRKVIFFSIMQTIDSFLSLFWKWSCESMWLKSYERTDFSYWLLNIKWDNWLSRYLKEWESPNIITSVSILISFLKD